MTEKKKKTFEPLFASTKEKMGSKEKIDFQESDIDRGGETVTIPPKSSVSSTEKENRTCRHNVYLTQSENEDFLNTLKRLEKPAVKIREIIIAYTKEWKSKNK